MATKTIKPCPLPTAWCEINRKDFRYNIRQIKGHLKEISKEAHLLPIIKANAYGHGMGEIAKTLEQEKITFVAVSNITEAITLRTLKFRGKILVFETTLTEHIPFLIQYQLIPTIATIAFAKKLNQYAKKINKKVVVHIEIDTGMSRLGVCQEESMSFIKQLKKCACLILEGVFTHFPVADTNMSFTQKQIRSINTLVDALKQRGIYFKYVHMSASMGVLRGLSKGMNLFRPGIMLYGLYPSMNLRENILLRPVMSVKTRVLLVKTIKQGTGVSYGHTRVMKNKACVAILGIGYSDGYLRSLSNKAFVIIQGKLCPVLGRVTMDQIIVDVSKIKKVSIGDEAIVLGSCKNVSVTADDLASWAGTINYEITCQLGNRLMHQYID